LSCDDMSQNVVHHISHIPSYTLVNIPNHSHGATMCNQFNANMIWMLDELLAQTPGQVSTLYVFIPPLPPISYRLYVYIHTLKYIISLYYIIISYHVWHLMYF
jgi:hypothetical protein